MRHHIDLMGAANLATMGWAAALAVTITGLLATLAVLGIADVVGHHDD